MSLPGLIVDDQSCGLAVQLHTAATTSFRVASQAIWERLAASLPVPGFFVFGNVVSILAVCRMSYTTYVNWIELLGNGHGHGDMLRTGEGTPSPPAHLGNSSTTSHQPQVEMLRSRGSDGGASKLLARRVASACLAFSAEPLDARGACAEARGASRLI